MTANAVGVPLPSLMRACPERGAPMMAVVPSADNATDHPDWSPAASPSMSLPRWVQVVPFQW
jgi:hypothetical protein